MAVITPFPSSPSVAVLRATAARQGVGACSDEQLVALLLGPRAHRGAAHAILERCGGLAGLTTGTLTAHHDAPAGHGVSVTLLAACELARRVASAWPEAGWQVRTPADLAERLVPAMGHLEQEELRVALLNTKNRVVDLVTLYVGNLAGTSVRVGEVYRDAVRRQAAAIVVVHNHPSGDPSPSSEDLRITGELAQAGRLLDIELLDHLVIGHGRWVSLRALGAVR
jgi:DNA repair protein RadC